MSFFPAGFDPRAEVLMMLRLVNVSTVDGDWGFLLGADGAFTDVTGKRWIGSTLITGGDDEIALGGVAPSGSFTFSFFQDPAEADVIAGMKDLGAAYVAGRALTFWVQPILSQAEFAAPTLPPQKAMTRVMRKLQFSETGTQQKAITLTYETVNDTRQDRRALIYNETDHARLIGAANPSLRFIPQTSFQQEKLFG